VRNQVFTNTTATSAREAVAERSASSSLDLLSGPRRDHKSVAAHSVSRNFSAAECLGSSGERGSFHQILGVWFFSGGAMAAIQRLKDGGLLVAPAAPALIELPTNADYRMALLNADLVIADSAFMVLLWRLLERHSIRRLSGLEYVRELLLQPEIHRPNNVFWIMASPESADRNLAWLRTQGIEVAPRDTYIAPMYGNAIEDGMLLRRLNEQRPQHIIVTLGGGTQEQLGSYLKRNLSYSPAIHCIGAAIAFLSGDQVKIPNWADKMYLGWFFRCISAPWRYVPRYWSARKLAGLILKYRDRLPVIESSA
jgi:exopolysaccharide biosynthesis WecB/TagA/CpsF family protein